ncbi:MAG TPA: TIGR03032 family protein [Polyangiaceae bacterium]|nr:TIGR03032 family protein [Polyangiaceae bacterium]
MADPKAEGLRSVSSPSFAQVLAQLKISLIVTTYQAGKVIVVRQDDGKINTHFRDFHKPMGCVADQNRLTIGGANTVWYLRNVPAVAPKLEPVGKHDAAYLPRRIHVTGDIDIHEMAWTKHNELWVINTRFSCLCTLDDDNSFIPRWRPHFVSGLAMEDRCHLNGLALKNGDIKYVTALGETDSAGGWRANKRDGGILMDVPKNEVLLRGLSMPHSPRIHDGKLYVLESGKGNISLVDLPTKKVTEVASVPGFTRGIDFYGPLAFIGLSQVRESATFSGLPLTERLQERTCGVWVVNLETGHTVAFLRFDAGVQEIFSVQVLRGITFPEIVPWNDPKMFNSYVLPDAALKDVVPAKPAPPPTPTTAYSDEPQGGGS